LPSVSGSDEVHLRFQQWFAFGSGDWGQVQVSVWDAASSTWGGWIDEGALVENFSGGWSLKDVDLTAYASETVRVAFFHFANDVSTNSIGWFVDEIEIAQFSPAFTGDFETGWDQWGADNGAWQVGLPTVGPVGCFAGTGCAGTVLDANYPTATDTRLISATGGGTDVHVRFQQWFSFGSGDWGQVQVSVWDSVSSTWGGWINVGAQVSSSSGGWSLDDVILTAYAGETVRIAFFHFANDVSTNSTGWFVDDIGISVF